MKSFYWDEKNCGSSLKKYFDKISNVESVFIATAFISDDGVDILQELVGKFNLERENIKVVLSSDFSETKPANILTRLIKIAKVRIAKEDRMFHPKVYYMQSRTEKLLVFGSSNLTVGGFGRNIEFDAVCFPDEDERVQIDRFVSYCTSQSEEVTDAHIRYYESIEEDLLKLAETKTKIKKKCRGFYKRSDPFTEDSYDLTGFYFQFEDYETFFPRNQTLISQDLDKRRKTVQQKLLQIHDAVKDRVLAFNVYPHWEKNNICSLTYPCLYNKNCVDWMGIRYGKRREEIIFGGGQKASYESFTKYACLQYTVYADGFFVVLFFAVENEAVDRQYLKSNLNRLADRINEQAAKLKGYGLKWKISGCPDFCFDTQSDLANYLKEYDRDGRFSSLQMYFAPNDSRIKTFEGICNEIVKGFELLKPLYDELVWRAKKL